MDTEIKDMLFKILEGQAELKTEVKSIKEEVKIIREEVKKHSLKFDAIEREIDTIAEVQTSHKEQNENSSKNLETKFEEETSLIEAAVRNISSDVKEVKESINVLKTVTGRHEVDINILKRSPV
ncbi:hypothetical protein [Clostridium sp.]|uniref:hypothetical protein n=1 Tax=Clostridium sp. TaxID=1506 RepID=UPI002FC945AE